MVNGHEQVWVERGGVVAPTEVRFESAAELEDLIERMIAPLGRRVDEASPICDARLPDGSRVNVVIPPLSLGGPALTIRRFRHSHFDPSALVDNGTLSARAHDFLAFAVERRLSLLVSGGTGSGKTTTLNALSAFVPERERIVTIEDAAELRLRQGHVVRLEARPSNLEGRGEVTIRALVRTALRMRPDRIVVGEVRGGEALDMLAAMTTGHDGSLTTVHANSPAGALDRVQTLALMAGVDVPHEAVRRMAASAIDLVVHQTRVTGGARRVAEIAEVTTGDGGDLAVRPLMKLHSDGEERWSEPTDARVANVMAGLEA
jgi:pilus assembly protein CpaF